MIQQWQSVECSGHYTTTRLWVKGAGLPQPRRVKEIVPVKEFKGLPDQVAAELSRARHLCAKCTLLGLELVIKHKIGLFAKTGQTKPSK
jgi:hypothetical protein